MIRILNEKDNSQVFNQLMKRTQFDFATVNKTVEEVLNQVKNYGDEALKKYTLAFDGARLDTFLVTNEEIDEAFKTIDPELLTFLLQAKENIETYHQQQIIKDIQIEKEGILIKQRVKPIESVGIYVPGGTASYPSTVLMNAVPAKIAGVKNLVMTTPPNRDGKIRDVILVAAKLAGIDQIYKIGGAQAIGALTYGTEQIPKVNKIVGPGNLYVTMAKKMVSGYVGIDLVAGPSEVLIIADEPANPDEIAADLMAQAEHDPYAAALLLTPSTALASAVDQAIERDIKTLSRASIIESSLTNFGAIIITDSLISACKLANDIAPEHLELMVENPDRYLDLIDSAGSIFLGRFTPEPVGDYVAGPNHTLPTSGTAKFASPLGVYDFVKRSSVVYYSEKAFNDTAKTIIGLAEAEGLTAHANAIKVRLK